MPNPYEQLDRTIEAPARAGRPVVADDANDLPSWARGLWIGGAGNLSVIFWDDEDPVLIVGVVAGTLLPFAIKRVQATGTTATDIVAVWQMSLLVSPVIEGLSVLAASGPPASLHFGLATNPPAADPNNPLAGELNHSSLAAALNEVSWGGTTPYARIVLATPVPVSAVWSYLGLEWLTSNAVDGPADVRTLFALLPTGELRYIWDARFYLNGGQVVNNQITNPGAPIDLSKKNQRLRATAPIVVALQAVPLALPLAP